MPATKKKKMMGKENLNKNITVTHEFVTISNKTLQSTPSLNATSL